ncbi:quinone oxidoreductase [Jeongeupia sp. USM3]|uniref:quinone oxidoreductase family protein n=1 Tax=Jeongeupia sp. USM3 TaxID=1906741 RepID=UPI00089DF8A1|nr:quinone oxidoreductase [Jeongeupia sp. USM3]AOY00843.1 quinone oxidoreductase [Jeongeupia sp. USM3]
MDTQVIRIHRHGDPDVLQLETITLAAPGAGEVLVRQTAIGVNFIDTYHRSGLYPLPMPSGLGQEACGVVEAVGDGVKEFRKGDRVAYAGGAPGAYAQHRIVPAARLVPVPDTISDDIAAGTLLRGMTAQYLLKRTFPVKAGMTVLIHAAAGGVGQIACQWARALGATVIGTAGGVDKCARASHWCDHVIDYRVDDFAARVREITAGAGVPVVYDGVGKETFDGSLDSLAPRGMLVSFGNASGAVPPFSPNLLAQKGSLFLTRPSLGHYTATRDELLDTAEDYFTAVARGFVAAEIGQRFALSEAALAHRELEARRTTGSTLLLP